MLNRAFLVQVVFVLVAFVELLLFVVQLKASAFDERMGDVVCPHVEDIASADHYVGIFAYFNGTGYVVDAEDLCSI